MVAGAAPAPASAAVEAYVALTHGFFNLMFVAASFWANTINFCLFIKNLKLFLPFFLFHFGYLKHTDYPR